MKRILTLSAITAALMGSALETKARFNYGAVYCDANNNRVIDGEDFAVQGVLVVITNASGMYSNAAWTTAQGEFVIDILPGADVYTDFIHPDTLPAGTIEVIPPFNVIAADGVQEIYTNYFLIVNATCAAPPPDLDNKCWLTGGGTIRVGKGKAAHTFAGVVNPGCKGNHPDGGNWLNIWHEGKLQLKSVEIEVVSCGNVENHPPGSSSPSTPYNFIEFQGVARLRGTAGNHVDYGMVHFFARAEDLGEPGGGVDGYYLIVHDPDGNVLLLVSANPDDPDVVAPVRISNGNLQMHRCKSDDQGKLSKNDKKQDQKGKSKAKDQKDKSDQNQKGQKDKGKSKSKSGKSK